MVARVWRMLTRYPSRCTVTLISTWNVMTISDILKIQDGTAFSIALSDLMYSRGGPAGLEGLRPAEQVVYCVDGLERDVNNGGFEQFFLNSPGEYARETEAALRTIGAHHTAALVEQAIAVFPGGPAPDQDGRAEQVVALSDGARARLDSLSAEFCEYRDDLSGLTRAYVAQHQGDFA